MVDPRVDNFKQPTDSSRDLSGRNRQRRRRVIRSTTGLSWKLIRWFWPSTLSLAIASAIVSATISGALGVGDSMHSSLRRLALERLGDIDSIVMSPSFFEVDLAERLMECSTKDVDRPNLNLETIVPAIVLEITIERPADGISGRDKTDNQDSMSSRAIASLLACDSLSSLNFTPTVVQPQGDAIAINATLASALGVSVGDVVVLRASRQSTVPSDSPLGNRRGESNGRRVTVQSIVSDSGLGRFGLRPTQLVGRLVIAPLAMIQDLFEVDGKVNILFATGKTKSGSTSTLIRDWMIAQLHPTLEDLGLTLEQTDSETIRLTSERLIIPKQADQAAAEILGPLGGKPSLVFLANRILGPGGESVPYSTIAAMAISSAPSGALVDQWNHKIDEPSDDQIVIDRWLADDFVAQGASLEPGMPFALEWFLPETQSGKVQEKSFVLRMSGIAAMQGAAIDRSLVPDVKGVTDEKSIADWDPPFPFDSQRVRSTAPHDEDDRYWKEFGATPKAFVSIARGREMAASRFGHSTAWHVPLKALASSSDTSLELLRQTLASRIDPQALGWRIDAVRSMAIEAASGTTPFAGLFGALSMFVVVSSLLLEVLLFRLCVQSLRKSLGILASVGWPRRKIAYLLMLFGGLSAAIGTVCGIVVGPLWTRTLLNGFEYLWPEGVGSRTGSSFVQLHVDGVSFVIAAVVSFCMIVLTLSRVALTASNEEPLQMLSGRRSSGARASKASRWVAFGTTALAIGASIATVLVSQNSGTSSAGMFFLAGSFALFGMLAAVWGMLLPGTMAHRICRSLEGLAFRGLVREPMRAITVVALVAVAEFLIVSVSAFRVSIPENPSDKAGPTGGWTLIASVSKEVALNIADPTDRAELGISPENETIFAGCTIESVRTSSGDDASCLNLYRPDQPRILGVADSFGSSGRFGFTTSVAAKGQNPWTLLNSKPDGAIPVILDEATARWALGLSGIGARMSIENGHGEKILLEVVGLLEPGILQGYAIVNESSFLELFPDRSGYGMFLFDSGSASHTDQTDQKRIRDGITQVLSDFGADVRPTLERLKQLGTLQNTYLLGFQSLGVIGLLLGIAGVAVVEVRSVVERTGQFGLLQAIGYSKSRLQVFILLETLFMALAGLFIGALAGLVALFPNLVARSAEFPWSWMVSSWLAMVLSAVVAGCIAASVVSRIQPAVAVRLSQ